MAYYRRPYYLSLKQLPLFQGVSEDRLSELVGKLPFHFLKFKDGETIVEPIEGVDFTEPYLRFIVSGTASMELRHYNLQVELHQELEAPNVVAPEYLFGHTWSFLSFPLTVRAVGECGVLQLLKSDFVNMMQTDKVFLFNMLNYLSLNIQRTRVQMLNTREGSVAERLAFYVNMFTTRLSKQVSVRYRKKDLCTLLGTTRTPLQTALAQLEADGIIEQGDGIITVVDRSELVNRSLK